VRYATRSFADCISGGASGRALSVTRIDGGLSVLVRSWLAASDLRDILDVFIEIMIGSFEALLKLSPPGTGLLRSIIDGSFEVVGIGGRSSSSERRGDSGAAVLHVVTLKREGG
jgi:hypothetical protein